MRLIGGWVKGRVLEWQCHLGCFPAEWTFIGFCGAILRSNGVQLPESFMQGIRAKNLAEKIGEDPKDARDDRQV